jgi:hypothetical protein
VAENKTKPTGVSVDDYLAAKASPEQREDCNALMILCERVTTQPATMWGPSIVGFGKYTYRYDTGRTGDAPLVGFAVRGRDLVVYINCADAGQAGLLAKLGKHRMGKSCLYFRRLADLDAKTLEKLVAGSVAELRRLYPAGGVA